ncbi:unnamed protein product, partial [Symbiodinium sp. CCMP2456]
MFSFFTVHTQNLATEVDCNLPSYFPDGHKVFCRWDKQDVPALAPEARLARCAQRRCLEIQVSGTCCYDWSAMNQHALKSKGPSQISFFWWKEGLKAHQPDLVLHENVLRFQVEHLLEGIEDLYTAFEFRISPWLGAKEMYHVILSSTECTDGRPRRFTALVHRRWHCSASQADFDFHFGACASMTGSDLLAMPPSIVQEYFRNKLRQKHCHTEGLLTSSDFTKVLTPRQKGVLQKFQELSANAVGDLEDDFLVDLSQTDEWTTASNDAPCLLRGSLIWSHKLQRTALPAEHLLLQGIPLLQDNSAWKKFVFDK